MAKFYLTPAIGKNKGKKRRVPFITFLVVILLVLSVIIVIPASLLVLITGWTFKNCVLSFALVVAVWVICSLKVE